MDTVMMKAYELERKGLEFYVDSAVKIKNILAKRTLLSLAQEEIGHMMKIDDIAVSLGVSGKSVNTAGSLGGSKVEAEIRNFFERADKELLNGNLDNVDLIKKAMELERKSFELYDDLGKKAKSEAEKRFYDELKKQEEGHFDALQNVHYYLTKTGDWFGKEESRTWDWMNL